MALPVLETQKYKMTIPSTKKQVEFRPFLVKEEKLLLLAQESNDLAQITDVMIDLINVCTFNKLDANKLTTVDLEYCFLQLRAKSVGETITTSIACEKCGEYNEVTFNINDVKIIESDHVENKFEIQDGVGIILKPILVKDAKLFKEDDAMQNLDVMLATSIETVYTQDELIKFSDTSVEERQQFIDSLPHSTMEDIQKYIEAQPKMSYVIKFTCTHCGHENEMEVSGLAGFFA